MLFGPKNSLILVYDHLPSDNTFEAQIDEVGRFYRFIKLSSLVKRLKKGKAGGRAAIVFSHARKSLFLEAVPALRAREIPVTVFLHPDCVGTNRLPAEEESTRPPIEEMDPTRFFATWGEILRLPPSLREFGIHLSAMGEESLAFIRKQTGETPSLGLTDAMEAAPVKGLDGVVTGKTGPVEKGCDPYSLPRWLISDD